MEIRIEDYKNEKIAVVESKNIVIKDIESAVDILGNCNYLGANKIIIEKNSIVPDFFDLKTRIAGEILQKFSNYRMRLAIVGDFSEYKSRSLKDFIFESNKLGQINFVNSIEEAKHKLCS